MVVTSNNFCGSKCFKKKSEIDKILWRSLMHNFQNNWNCLNHTCFLFRDRHKIHGEKLTSKSYIAVRAIKDSPLPTILKCLLRHCSALNLAILQHRQAWSYYFKEKSKTQIFHHVSSAVTQYSTGSFRCQQRKTGTDYLVESLFSYYFNWDKQNLHPFHRYDLDYNVKIIFLCCVVTQNQERIGEYIFIKKLDETL